MGGVANRHFRRAFRSTPERALDEVDFLGKTVPVFLPPIASIAAVTTLTKFYVGDVAGSGGTPTNFTG